MKKNLFIATAPNIQKDDLWVVFKALFAPWKWRQKQPVEKFEQEMGTYLSEKYGRQVKAVAFDSARSSFYLLLKEYGIGKGDEVLVPSFTCVVIINSVLKAGATPVYVDINERDFNIDLKDLKKKLTKNTKSILVQHTFGVPVDVKKVREIVGPKVKIIEDMAHILGANTGNQSDAQVLTFGIEKMMTTLRGGMAVVSDENLYRKLKEEQKKLPQFSFIRIYTWLINPLIWAYATPLYYVGIGRLTVGRMLSQLGHVLGFMGNMVEKVEYSGGWPKWIPAQMPGAHAKLGMNQLRKLDGFNEHRRNLAKIYEQELNISYSDSENYTPIRFPVIVEDKGRIVLEFKRDHIVLGNWYERILFTKPQFIDELKFVPSENPTTIKMTPYVVNLPLFIHVTEEDARYIARKIKPYITKVV